eukprot:TRINITY_DN3326_c0_g1_i2.p1 TRINITY_DN3326_c0_g1~~TRINITY_DN3326_c0_g1_i2.p1  ORF type:complete len:679 (+),score=197.55 TRINITY_DN3326_c0_g1_i2:83-2038(+)
MARGSLTETSVSFKVPLLRRTQELRFQVGRTVRETEGCIKWKLCTDDQGGEFMMWLVVRDALDALDDQEQVEERINTQLAVLKLLDHNNILKLFQVFSTNDVVYVLFERRPLALSDLLSDRGAIAEHGARELSQQVLNALGYLHGKGLAHRNLRPEDVVLDDGAEAAAVSGLGFCAIQEPGEQLSDRPQGLHPVCAAPELRSGKEPYDAFRCDVWGFGCVLCAVLCGGDLPSPEGKLPPSSEGLSPEVVSLLSGALVPDPQKRLTLQEVMGHRWITQEDGDATKSPVSSGSLSPPTAAFSATLSPDAPLNHLAVRQSFRQVSTSMQFEERRMSRAPSFCDGAMSPTGPAPRLKDICLNNTPVERALEPRGRAPSLRLSPRAGGRNKMAGAFSAKVLAERSGDADHEQQQPHAEVDASEDFLVMSPMGAKRGTQRAVQAEGTAMPPAAKDDTAAPVDPSQRVTLRVRISSISKADDSEPWVAGQTFTFAAVPASATGTEVKQLIRAEAGIPVGRQQLQRPGGAEFPATTPVAVLCGEESTEAALQLAIAPTASRTSPLRERPAVEALEALQPHHSDVSGACVADTSLREAWAAFGSSEAGWISKDAFQRVYGGDDMGLGSEVDKMIDLFPTSGPGRLTFDEFSVLVLRLAQR